MNQPFYLTTTLPYVNAEPHIGFALEIIQADAIARYQSLLGNEVFFNFGTDEHGLKIYRKAQEQDIDPQTYCDEYAAKFDRLKQALNLSYNNFIRTTDAHHIQAAQEFWKLCDKNGDIYKQLYLVKYCVGCEMEKTESELVDGRCPIHPNQEIETIEEENYFFRWSKYQQPLLDYYAANPQFVLPDSRFNEIKAFVSNGLQDFSISRLKAKMPWGIPVPGDDDHVMYVWFDALVNYISALGWPENTQKFKTFWVDTHGKPNALQLAGKDNLRQQSAMWQAMLMSAGLPNSRQILIHGFMTVEGQKMSKSLGNVVDPIQLVSEFGTDAVRYYLLAEVTPFGDSDFSLAKFIHRYNSDLANGLGNLVARLVKLSQELELHLNAPTPLSAVSNHLDNYEFDQALHYLWQEHIAVIDKQLNESQPWNLQTDQRAPTLIPLLNHLNQIAFNLQPFLPETAQKIITLLGQKDRSDFKPLFPRIQTAN